jgi:uncharacterized protein (TIGR03435 family)
MIYAYRGDQFTLRPEQIVGGPSWLNVPLFDIDAKVEGDPSPEPIPMVAMGAALLRSLLEDRFKLKMHVETRPLPAYVLLVNESNGRLGPWLRPSLVDCQALLEESSAHPEIPLPPPPAGRPQCGTTVRRLDSLVAGGMTTERLALAIGGAVHSLVVDRTELLGSYDVELTWRPESMTFSSSDVVSDHPSIFTAVREQLGLKLERRREAVDVVVIDHVERPSED